MTGSHVGLPPPFVTHMASAEGRALVRLIGELDVAAAPHARQAIERAERRRDAGRQLLLRRGPRAVHRVFEVTALAPLFEFVD